jgi:hypothetical protein
VHTNLHWEWTAQTRHLAAAQRQLDSSGSYIGVLVNLSGTAIQQVHLLG